ncbi:MAG: leucine--tRNA ligase [Pseudomonadota bacterium]
MSHTYDPSVIEPRWQQRWEESQAFRAVEDPAKPKYYTLGMFPYPSGSGLHVGHPLSYTALDIVARYKRACGFAVLNPMGFDSFGLPAERAAVREGRHPADITRDNIAFFTKQLKRLGFSYDWERQVVTSDPDYYRWTQWTFLKMIDLGLAYMAEVPVYWCPAQGTVLANEEVQDGKYIETGEPVQRRLMRQWMLRITAFAQRLLDDLDELDWPESTKEMQRNWIGRSEGAMVTFPVADREGQAFEVFTTRPDTLYGCTWCVLAPEHALVEQITAPEHLAEVRAYVRQATQRSDLDRQVAAEKEKTGVFTGAFAVNPVNGQRVPIWVADYVLATYGTGAIMAVPAHDERDHAFAKKFGLPIIEVISGGEDVQREAYTGDGLAVNSPLFDGLAVTEAKRTITTWLEERGLGHGEIQYKLRDWLFSRQRYWGEPFPMVHTPDGRVLPLPADSLPLTLPVVDEYRPTADGQPPLARATDWVQVEVDGQVCERETNSMPQWAGSCWYWLRYMDPMNTELPVGADAERYWGPVDLYIGGKEHAVTHLLYARFWHKVLYDLGVVHTKEPFQKLFHQGMILAYSYRDEGGKYYRPEDCERRVEQETAMRSPWEPKTIATDWYCGDIPVERKLGKMGKSRMNSVDPLDIIRDYGADALRTYEMFMGPLEQLKDWQTGGVKGTSGFLARVWRLVVDEETGGVSAMVTDAPMDRELRKALHLCVKEATEAIEALRFNTPVSRMMELVNLATQKRQAPTELLVPFLQVLQPWAPHIAEELWERLGLPGTCGLAPWPAWDPAALVEDVVQLGVQINGKVRGQLEVPAGTPEAEIVAAALEVPNVVRHLEGMQVIKSMVRGRLVILVAKPG